MRLAILILCLALSGEPGFAQDDPTVAARQPSSEDVTYAPPLLPSKNLPRLITQVKPRRASRRRSRRPSRPRYYAKRPARAGRSAARGYYVRPDAKEMSLQLATVGKPQNTNGGFLGMAMFIGVRGALDLPLSRKFVLQPSLGLLYGSQGAKELRLSQLRLESGLDFLWTPNVAKKTRFRAGLANRFDTMLVRLSAFDSSGSDLAIGYRVGPTAGIDFGYKGRSVFSLTTEVTFDLLNGAKTHLGLGMGVKFPL